MRKRSLVSLSALAFGLALSAAAQTPVSSLAACTASIGPHAETGCYMNATWHGEEAAGERWTAPSFASGSRPALARAIVPLDAELEGGGFTYQVTFQAIGSPNASPLDENLQVKLWLADDQGENRVPLREVRLSVGEGPAPVTILAEGKATGYAPHYLYASFSPLRVGDMGGGPDLAGTTVTIEGTRMAIVPTTR
jgi:hypothetical protein